MQDRSDLANRFLIETYQAFQRKLLGDALSRRKEKGTIVLDLTHPFFMYLSVKQGQRYEQAITQPEFQSQLYDPLATMYQEAANRLGKLLPQHYDYVDLGPGYTAYLQTMNRELFRTSPPRFYVPVDINGYLLNKICRYVRTLRLPTVPLNTLFELLPSQLNSLDLANGAAPKLFNFGLTFNNYTPDRAIRLLLELLGKDGWGMVCTEECADAEEEIVRPYRTVETERFNYSSLRSLGIPRAALAYQARFRQHRVEMGFVVRQTLELPQIGRLIEGDFLLTCISYRHPQRVLLRRLGRSFRTVRVLTSEKQNQSSLLYIALVSNRISS
jgi:hypothetical protein